MQNDNVIPINHRVSDNTYSMDDNGYPSNAYIELFISSLAYKKQHEILVEILTQLEIIDYHVRSLVVNQKEISRLKAPVLKAYIAAKALELDFENKNKPTVHGF